MFIGVFPSYISKLCFQITFGWVWRVVRRFKFLVDSFIFLLTRFFTVCDAVWAWSLRWIVRIWTSGHLTRLTSIETFQFRVPGSVFRKFRLRIELAHASHCWRHHGLALDTFQNIFFILRGLNQFNICSLVAPPSHYQFENVSESLQVQSQTISEVRKAQP